MSKKKFIIIVAIGVLSFAIGVGYYFFYRPDWQVEKITRAGELTGQTVQTVVAERNYQDFKFSGILNGLAAYIADLPVNTDILSLHIAFSEVFTGEDGAMPSLQVMIQNDDGTACTIDLNNAVGEIQLLAAGKICAIGQKSSFYIRDASAMHTFKSGDIKVFVSYIVL